MRGGRVRRLAEFVNGHAWEMDDRDQFLTIYGRQAVLEALLDGGVEVDKVLVDRTARGGAVEEILAAAAQRGLKVERVAAERVTRLSRNGRQDQGVVADVVAPNLTSLDAWVAGLDPSAPVAALVLDGLTTPANVGMVIRTATAAGLDAVVVPRMGVAEIGPLVVKASAGVAFRAPLVRSATAVEAVDHLAGAGLEVIGLRGDGAEPLFDAPLPSRGAYVLGNESAGVSDGVAGRVGRWVAIPLANGVESLNVGAAAAVLSYEVARQRR